MKGNLNIAIVQYDVQWHEVNINLEKIQTLLERLKYRPDLILLPEMFATGFTMRPDKISEDQTNKLLHWMKSISVSYNAYILGSHPVKQNNAYYNRLICYSPDGKVEFYDKRHLFSLGSENLYYQPGLERKVFQIHDWRVFPIVCYDLRFPVWCRNDLNYDLIINIANWPVTRMNQWDILLKARAIENQCYIAGVNRTGKDAMDIEYNGHSKVISMKGDPIKEMGVETGVMEMELDKSALIHYRQKFPFLSNIDSFSIT